MRIEPSQISVEAYQKIAFIGAYVDYFNKGSTPVERLAEEASVLFDVMRGAEELRKCQSELEACAREFPKPYGQAVEQARNDLTGPGLQ
ncbi:hypothetical protein D6745_03815 [Candidatus Woesearchaeota archaeon]|nr:MAG: hypothetical protein D6745_03815 [Candidatus Woesearchaeota archaeon]